MRALLAYLGIFGTLSGISLFLVDPRTGAWIAAILVVGSIAIIVYLSKKGL